MKESSKNVTNPYLFYLLLGHLALFMFNARYCLLSVVFSSFISRISNPVIIKSIMYKYENLSKKSLHNEEYLKNGHVTP